MILMPVTDGRKRQSVGRFLCLCGALTLGLWAGSVLAQRPPGGGGDSAEPSGPAINPDDYFEFTDHNGVDLSNGQRLDGFSVDGGAAGSLTWRRGFNWEFWIQWRDSSGRGSPFQWIINNGLSRHTFAYTNNAPTTFHPTAADGSTLERLSNGDMLFTDRDGDTILFPPLLPGNSTGVVPQARAYAKYKQMASGLRYTVKTSTELVCTSNTFVAYPYGFPHPSTGMRCSTARLYVTQFHGVETSNGFFVKDDQTSIDSAGRRVVTDIIGNQNARYCDVLAPACALDQQGYNWLHRVYPDPNSNLNAIIIDKIGRERFGTSTTASDGRTLSNLVDFGRQSNDPLYSIDHTQPNDNPRLYPGTQDCRLANGSRRLGVQRFITADGTSSYSLREDPCQPTIRVAEVSYPDNSSTLVHTDVRMGGSGRPTIMSRRPTVGASTIDDGVNRITRYEYSTRQELAGIVGIAAKNNLGARLIRVTYPEGNYVEFDYDDRRNVTQQRSYPKPGSGEPVLTTTLSFPATCSNPKSCNKPTAVTDPNGNTTNYTYAPQHGGMLTVTGPPDASGVRPQTRYEYAQRYAWYKNASGNYVQGPVAHWLLVKEEFCKTTAASGNGCAGGASDEVVTTYDYGPNSGPNNLLLRGIIVTADGQSLRTCFGYDKMGRRISETQPKGTGGTCP